MLFRRRREALKMSPDLSRVRGTWACPRGRWEGRGRVTCSMWTTLSVTSTSESASASLASAKAVMMSVSIWASDRMEPPEPSVSYIPFLVYNTSTSILRGERGGRRHRRCDEQRDERRHSLEGGSGARRMSTASRWSRASSGFRDEKEAGSGKGIRCTEYLLGSIAFEQAYRRSHVGERHRQLGSLRMPVGCGRSGGKDRRLSRIVGRKSP